MLIDTIRILQGKVPTKAYAWALRHVTNDSSYQGMEAEALPFAMKERLKFAIERIIAMTSMYWIQGGPLKGTPRGGD